MNKKCAGCNEEITTENSPIGHKVHVMTHLLIDQLNTMNPSIGFIAMADLMCSVYPDKKEEFLKDVEQCYDSYHNRMKYQT